MSNKKILQNQINAKLDLLLDDFDGQYDLIDFEKEMYIPIVYELKSLDSINLNHNSDDFFRISFDDDSNCIKTTISKDDFNERYHKLNDSRQHYLKKNGFSNIYLVYGLLEFDSFLAPCILIPIFIEKCQEEYRIFRNHNQEIQFNGILKFISDEENVHLPMFDGNISDFINLLKNSDNINYYNDAYIGNFDLKFQCLLYDLNIDNWCSIQEKYELFEKGKDIFTFNEKNIFDDALETNAKRLEIEDDIFHLKSLLSLNNSILIISDDEIADEIVNSFRNDDLESLILRLSENMSENNFYEDILNSEKDKNEDIIKLDNIVKKYDDSSKILHLINTNYSNFEINPKEIKMRKDHFAQIIDDLNLDNFVFEIGDVNKYNEEFCKEMEEQIREISTIDENIFNLQNYFSLEYLDSEEFNKLVRISNSLERHIIYFKKLNKKLNEDYKIKIFEELFSVNKLINVSILDKNPILIEDNDFDLLNEYLENRGNINNIQKNDLSIYFESDEDIIESIDINLKYTELIKERIISFDSVELILDDYDLVVDISNYIYSISNYILKEILDIINFYNSFELLEIDSDLLKVDMGFENIERLINRFKMDIVKLVDFKQDYTSFNILNSDVKMFIKFVYNNEFNNDEIGPIFWYNIYNSLLDNFLCDYNYIDENKIIDGYESEFDEVKSKLVYDNEQLLIQHIYSKSLELNNSEKSINQKSELIRKNNFEPIKIMLSKYKDFITANKRIFIMDMGLVSQLLDESYENHFDYVIITKELKYDLDRLSLSLRSKNKIIMV